MAPRRANQVDRSDRVAVFGKTKLCKFHVLGVCSKGTACNFAHEQNQLNHLPDLAKTRICKTLISTGQCSNPDCLYAHSKDELRDMPPAPEKVPAMERRQSHQTSHVAQLHPMPNFALAFGQGHSTQVQNPLAHAMMLQQMAAQLSMQAAILQAQPSVQPSAQFSAQQREIPRSTEPNGQKIPVELSILTSAPRQPEFTKIADAEPAKIHNIFTPDSTPCQMSPYNLERKRFGCLATFEVFDEPEENFSNSIDFDDKKGMDKKNFQDTLVPQHLPCVTVKNTFLNFHPEHRSDGMRAVQTYSGGLTFMTGQSDDDDDEA